MELLSITLPTVGFILICFGIFCAGFTGGMMLLKAALGLSDPCMPVPETKRKLKAGPAKIISYSEKEIVLDENELAIS